MTSDEREHDSLAPPAGPVLDALVSGRQRFVGFLARRLHDPSVAEDLFHTAVLRAIRGRETLRDEERVTAWIYRILRNVLADHRRHEGALRRSHDRAARVAPYAEPPPDLAAEICRCVAELLPTVSEQYAEALRLVELEGMTPAAAAAELGLSAGAFRVRLHRARSALRQRVEQACRTCSTHGCLDCTCRSAHRVPPV